VDAFACFYHAGETDAIRQAREELRFVPDSYRVQSSFGLGVRKSIAYGKALIGRRIVYFDPQGFAHLGVLTAEEGRGPQVDLGLALVARPTARFQIRFELAALIQGEERLDGTWHMLLGFQPSLAAGMLF
jgi:hypothetical protein